MHLGRRLAGLPPAPTGLSPTLRGLVRGTLGWPTEATVVLAGLVVSVLAAAAVIALWWARRRRRASRVDWTASVLGRGREIEGISSKNVTATAKRLGVSAAAPGITVGRTVAPPRDSVLASWEDMMLLLAGPRIGKSTSYAIPAILDAPGAALVTSNKRDLADATRDPRAAAGSEVWIFDPQNVAGEEPTWWWDPLSYVTDEVKAATLADHFSTNSKPVGAKVDGYFEPAGKDLLAGLLLAAAQDGRPITDVYRWLTRHDDKTPADLLEKYHFPLTADNVAGVIARTEKQRDGIYGTAQQMASCLTTRSLLRWVTDDGSSRRRHFDPAAFVRENGTLYSLSREGRGNAGALVTALTNAVTDAAEDLATTQPGGRLTVPLVGVLDEIANVCRWRELPGLYSHYGSRGIILMSILQSWAQGVGVWGKEGMDALWSATNVAIYGGNIKDRRFLEDLSSLIGTYDKKVQSVSTRATGGMWSSGTQMSTQIQREAIMDVADLAALPKGRAVVLSSGNRPTLVETLPWMTGPRAAEVQASYEAHDPQAARTLREAAKSLAQVQAQLSALGGEDR